jgi:hypothetical protein
VASFLAPIAQRPAAPLGCMRSNAKSVHLNCEVDTEVVTWHNNLQRKEVTTGSAKIVDSGATALIEPESNAGISDACEPGIA